MMETIDDHMGILRCILDHWERFRYEDDSLDSSEAQWYETWDMVLNWLRLQSNSQLSVAPQIRLTNIVYRRRDNTEDTRSTDANVGSDVAPVDDPEELCRIARIPDFGVFYTTGLKRMLPLIVEIKADNGRDPTRVMENTVRQTLVQARHVFDIYGGHKNLVGPPTLRLYIFCAVAMKFWMYHVDREDLPFLPTSVQRPDDPEPFPIGQFVRRIQNQVEVWPVFNEDMTNYSDEFWDAWNDFTDYMEGFYT
ncbi:hypothetical protein E4T56_gene18783 [Termitomyces sp. T112]|nr:hypothetical protein E4T56_gene18783 [Termitomyces sp. T112]